MVVELVNGLGIFCSSDAASLTVRLYCCADVLIEATALHGLHCCCVRCICNTSVLISANCFCKSLFSFCRLSIFASLSLLSLLNSCTALTSGTTNSLYRKPYTPSSVLGLSTPSKSYCIFLAAASTSCATKPV